MKKLLVLFTLLLAPPAALAETPAAGDAISEDESILMCAEALPKQLDCKSEFCAAMVKIRNPGSDQADLKKKEALCAKEIAVDGTGDLSTRKGRCAGWIKNRPKLTLSRGDAKAMDACWAESSCQARIDCWAPKMAKLMQSAAPKKK